MVHVLVTIPFGEPFLEQLRAVHPSVEATEASQTLRQLLRGDSFPTPEAQAAAERDAAEVLPRADVIVGWARFPASALQWSQRLRWIQSVSAGIDRLEDDVLRQVTLTNGTGLGAEPIGEHVITMLMMLARGMPAHTRNQAAHRWVRNTQAREVAGMTMAIIGMGAIGSAVARRARGLGLRVCAIRRSVTQRGPDEVADEVCPPGDLDDLLASSDVVVLSTPLTNETRGLLSAERIAKMRPGSYLINIARGAVVDEQAMIAALQSGHLAGAGLDVFEQEPLPADSPLWDLPNVIITPHVAAGSDRYDDRLRDLVCDNLRRYIDGQPLRNLVDFERGY